MERKREREREEFGHAWFGQFRFAWDTHTHTHSYKHTLYTHFISINGLIRGQINWHRRKIYNWEAIAKARQVEISDKSRMEPHQKGNTKKDYETLIHRHSCKVIEI